MNKLELYFQSRISEIKKKFPNILDQPYFKDRVNGTILVLVSMLLIIVWIISVVSFHISEYVVPVRYNSFLGVTQLGGWIDLYKIPLIYTIYVVLNFWLSRVVYKSDRFISYMIIGSGLFTGILAAIIIVNFSRILGV